MAPSWPQIKFELGDARAVPVQVVDTDLVVVVDF